MNRITALTIAGLLALTAAACGGDDDAVDTEASSTVAADDGGSSPSDDPADPGDDPGTPEGPETPSGPFEGQTWSVIEIDEAGEPRPLVEGSEITLAFDPADDVADALPSVAMYAGCNQIGASYDSAGDGIEIYEGRSTAMGCEQPLMDQEAWLMDTLSGEGTWSMTEEHTLVLVFGDATITLAEQAEPAASDLVGPTWTLDSLIANEAVSTVPGGVVATVAFADDGTLQVDTGCNTGGAGYTVADDTIEIEPMRLTRRACTEDGASEVEAAITLGLEGTVTWEISGDRLTVTSADGTTGLGFTAA